MWLFHATYTWTNSLHLASLAPGLQRAEPSLWLNAAAQVVEVARADARAHALADESPEVRGQAQAAALQAQLAHTYAIKYQRAHGEWAEQVRKYQDWEETQASERTYLSSVDEYQDWEEPQVPGDEPVPSVQWRHAHVTAGAGLSPKTPRCSRSCQRALCPLGLLVRSCSSIS